MGPDGKGSRVERSKRCRACCVKHVECFTGISAYCCQRHGANVGVLEDGDEVGLDGFLESTDGRVLEVEIELEW